MSAGIKVRDMMTSDVFTLDRNEKLGIADDMMRLGRVRHIPVTDAAGAVVGIVTQRDLFFNALMRTMGQAGQPRKQLDDYRVEHAMRQPVLTTTPDALAAEAARLMLERKIGCLPVLDGGRLVGIVTESDFVTLAAKG